MPSLHTGHQHEQALNLTSHEIYQFFFAEARDAVILTNQRGQSLVANIKASALLGYTTDELLMLDWSDICIDQEAVLSRIYRGTHSADQPAQLECHLRHKQGQAIDVDLIIYRLGTGELILSMRDITAQKHREEWLSYQATILNHAADAIIATDTELIITSWNRAAEQLYGWSAEEVIGRSMAKELSLGYTDAQLHELRQHITQHGQWSDEITPTFRDGTTMEMLCSATAVKDRTTQAVGIVLTHRDIRARKHAEKIQADLEEQLYQAQKMESLGKLVGGIAHNFNNLLTVIQGYSELIESQIAYGDPILDDLAQIQAASQRAATLTRQLLAFGRKQRLAPAMINLNETISNFTQMIEQVIQEHITLIVRLQLDLWRIIADPSQIEQMTMNLILNARDAMHDGGHLIIETHNQIYTPDPAREPIDLAPGAYVVVSFSDTGSGMDAQTRSQIFDPFFTTKRNNQGTGMGLSTVYGTMKQSGGAITVESEPGLGTTFRLYFPATHTM
jgi:two-component system cell cycle sensor histidine kinase/response regulator CckA